MRSFDYQFSAQIQRWFCRDNPSWLARRIARSAERHARQWLSPIISQEPLETPAVVVGGLTLGGAGKTPVTALIAHILSTDLGLRTAVICRGWLGEEQGPRRVQSARPVTDGDEAAMLFRMLRPEISLWASRDLEAGRLMASPMADVVVIDDGFQTSKLRRSHSIVVVDATAPRRMIPAGPYREPISAVERANLIWLHKADEPGAEPLRLPNRADVVSRYAAQAILLANGQRVEPAWLEGRDVIAVCGIGRPDSFLYQLRLLGARVQGGIICGDHRSPSVKKLDALPVDTLVVTTSKDAARWCGTRPPAVLEVGVEVLEGHDRLAGFLAELSLTR